VIGDIPYGDARIVRFPADIAQINADPDVRRVLHLGDIKNGSSRCDDAYLAARLADFEIFSDAGVHAGRQRVDRLPPGQQRRLRPDRAPGQDSRPVLRPAPETTAETALRGREYTAREAAALAWIDATFDAAERRRAPGVVLGMQADPAPPRWHPDAFS